MEPEMRAARADEMGEFMHIVHMSFGMPSDFSIGIRPDWTFCAFMGGQMATTSGVWPLTMQFLNAQIPVAGITWVGTNPVYRRRNLLRQLMEANFRQLYENKEFPVAGLFASQAAIYHRYGYGVVTTKNAYSVEPQNLRFALECPTPGDFREASDGDLEVMLDIYHRFAEQRIGYFRRGEAMQTAQGAAFTVLRPRTPTQPPIKIIYQESGRAQGYLIYANTRDSVTGNKPRHRVSILDMVWLSTSAYRAIWDLLAKMDLSYRVEWGKAPPDDPLPHLLLEPRRLNITSSDDLMARIIDVERALPLRLYGGEGTLVFEVIDDICAWNRGKWELSVSDNKNDIRRTQKEAQVVVPVSTLGMLMLGQLSPSMAARMGRMDVNDHRALRLWDSLMATPCKPSCADFF